MRAVLFLRIPLPESRDRSRRKVPTDRSAANRAEGRNQRRLMQPRARAHIVTASIHKRERFSCSRILVESNPSLPRSLFQGEINV